MIARDLLKLLHKKRKKIKIEYFVFHNCNGDMRIYSNITFSVGRTNFMTEI